MKAEREGKIPHTEKIKTHVLLYGVYTEHLHMESFLTHCKCTVVKTVQRSLYGTLPTRGVQAFVCNTSKGLNDRAYWFLVMRV